MLGDKVYIIDYELISPIAVGREHILPSIRSGLSADRIIERIDTSGLPYRKAGEVREDLTGLYVKESEQIREACRHDRKLELLAACYGKANNRLKPLIELFDREKTGVILGVGADVTPFEQYEKEMVEHLLEGRIPINELFTDINSNNSHVNCLNNPYDLYAIYLARKFNAGAFQKSVLTACVSSTQAIALGYDAIQQGEAEVVVTGGVDSLINMLALISFGKLGVIAESSDDVSCKPFDVNRNGTLAGESAGFAVLASETFVRLHNLSATAQLLGYGNTLDAYKITAPDPNGKSMEQAVKDALNYSNIRAEQIDYILAHGTGTRQNDQLELNALESVLGSGIPVSSTKDRHGHAIAAAGIQEFCILLELMKGSLIPRNLNMKTPCDTNLDLVKEDRESRINYALTSNFAFGGINTVMAVKNELNET